MFVCKAKTLSQHSIFKFYYSNVYVKTKPEKFFFSMIILLKFYSVQDERRFFEINYK